MKFQGTLILALIALAVIFILQNIASVSVTFLFFTITMPRALLLTITLVVGIFIGLMMPKKR